MNATLKRDALRVVYAALAYFSWITGVTPWIHTMSSSNWHQGVAEIITTSHDIARGRGETNVTYRFPVGDDVYHGDRLTFWKWAVTWDRSLDPRIAKQAAVNVYYDPNDPSRNVLFRKVDRGRALLSIVPIVYVLFILSLVVSRLRRREKGRLPIRESGSL